MFHYSSAQKIIACLFCFTFLVSINSHAATITGLITYEGVPPKLRPIKMKKDKICVTHHKGAEVSPKTIILGENNELANVFVHVAKGVPSKDWPVPSEPVVLDQKGCMYDPPVFGVMVGQDLKILNPDGTLHNVNCLTKKNKAFNIAMPKFKKETTRTFTEPELWFKMKCDVHPWMVTYGNVLSHPFYDATSEDGRFTIENLPAGEYTIEAKQQRLSPQTATVTVAEGETKEVNFVFRKPEDKRKVESYK